MDASRLAKASRLHRDGREAAAAGLRPLTGERQGVLQGDDEAGVGRET